MIKTAIVILNWNTQHQLKEFLPFLIEHSSDLETEIYVADNCSSDHSLEMVNSNFPGVKTIKLDRNYGFAEGYNRALKFIEAKYYLLINSDIEVTHGWLKPLIDTLEFSDEIKACMPILLSYKQRDTFEYAGAAGGYIDYLGYPFCKGRIFDSIEKNNGQFTNTYEIFWATGACLAIKAETFNSLGGFDSYFFAHMEEIDLCWRIKNLGHKIVCCSNSIVYHVGGGTLNKSNPWKTYLNFRNNLILLHKNLSWNKRLYILPIRYFLNFVSIAKFLKDGNYKDANAVLKSYFGFIYYLISQKHNRYTKIYPSLIYQKSIIIDFFIRKKVKFSDLNFEKYASK